MQCEPSPASEDFGGVQFLLVAGPLATPAQLRLKLKSAAVACRTSHSYRFFFPKGP